MARLIKDNEKEKLNGGYITLVVVLIVVAMAAAIGGSLLVFGTANVQNMNTLSGSESARFYADSCLEEALQQIRSSSSYAGSGNLSWSDGSCSYNVSNTGGQNRLVNATGTVGSIIRKARAVVTAINPQIITSWQEVGD